MKYGFALHIHVKGGNPSEAEYCKKVFREGEVFGIDYNSNTPWDFAKEVAPLTCELNKKYENIALIANSIGAYFPINSLGKANIKKAFLISPGVNMEKLILNLMKDANVSEKLLKEKGIIKTPFGEDLSREYL